MEIEAIRDVGWNFLINDKVWRTELFVKMVAILFYMSFFLSKVSDSFPKFRYKIENDTYMYIMYHYNLNI